MKKIVLMLAICFIYSASVFAKDINPMSFGTNPLVWNSDIKLSLYADSVSRAESNKWPAFVLNLILGFGIGSYVQGDIVGGTIGLVGEILPWGLIIGGIFVAPATNSESSYMDARSKAAIGMMISGLLVLLGVRIFEMVRPFTYANKVSVAFVPDINDEGKPKFTSYVSFKY